MSSHNLRQPEPVSIRIKHPNRKTKQKKLQERLHIGSFNIQKTRALHLVAHLASNYDVFFIQEFPAHKINLEAISDYAVRAGMTFHSSPTGNRIHNQTGIFIKRKLLQTRGTSELSLDSAHKRYVTDVRVQLPNGDQLLLINLYLPSADKMLQAEILGDISFSLDPLKVSIFKSPFRGRYESFHGKHSLSGTSRRGSGSRPLFQLENRRCMQIRPTDFPISD